MKPDPCCGEVPGIKSIIGSAFRLRVVGCEICRKTSVARMHDADAIRAWNDGLRNDRDGHAVPPAIAFERRALAELRRRDAHRDRDVNGFILLSDKTLTRKPKRGK